MQAASAGEAGGWGGRRTSGIHEGDWRSVRVCGSIGGVISIGGVGRVWHGLAG